MRIRQIKDIRCLFAPTSKRKMSKQKKRGLILALSTLLFVGGIWGQAEDVSANAPDTYIQNQLNGAFNNNSTTYTYRGYFSIHGGASNVNHRWGRFTDPTPNITVQNSLYHPRRFNYEAYRYIEMYSPMADWGFVPGITAQWDGGMYTVPSGVGAGWQRSARVDYTRHKTVPETRGVTVSGHDYVSGNEYWVRQGNSVQARVHGRQDFNGTKWRWNDFVTINFMRMTGNSTVQGNMNHSGSYSNDTTHAHLTISGNNVSRQNNLRDLYTTFNVRGNTHGTRHQFNTYARSANGRNDGYLATGKFLNVDGVAPTRGTVTLGGARYVNGNDHWVRPGERVTAQMSATDADSGVAQTNIRVHGSGNDVRARHRYRDASGTTNEFRSDGGDVTVTGGTRIRSSNPMTYRFNVDTKTGIGNKTFNVADYHIDNVGNPAAYVDSGLRIRTDATAPTISANPASRDWGNSNVTVALTHADGQSGIATRQYAWSTSTATPSSWTNYSSAVTQSNSGTWYLHARAVDNVGHVTTERFGPYRIDKTTPNANSSSILNARYTNGNDHWVRPGDSVVIRTSGFDDESRMRNTNIRLFGDGNDNRAEYRWDQRPTDVREYQTTGGYTSIYGGEEENWGWTSMYRFNVRANTNAGNRTFNVQTYFRDNADNNTGWIDSGLNLRTDATAPTISANTTSSAWGNGNQAVTLTYADGQSGIATRQFAWSTSTATPSSWTNYSSAVTQSTQGTWYLHARAVDNVGHVTTERFGPYRIDKTAPNGSISGNPTAWQNTNATLTFNATDSGGSGVRRVRIAGGTWVNGSTTTQTATANGTYSFEVEDNAGNTRTVSANVTRIDKAAPNGSITGNPTSWTNQNATLTFNATDTGGSGVRRVRIAGGTWVNSSTTTQTATANGTYSFEVEDNAGNTRTVSANVTRIDKDPPTIAFNHNPSTWTNGNVTTTIRARDFGSLNHYSGMHQLRFRPQGGTWSGWTTYGNETERSSAWFEQTRTITSNGTYEAQVQDRAGNTSSRSFTVDWIDRTLPNASSSQSPTGWTNGNVTITWNASATGSPLQQVRTHNGSAWSGWTTISGPSRTQTQVVSSNGTYQFQVQDAAGNVRQISHTVSNIDKAAPNGTITGNPTAWQNTNATLTFNATDTGGSGVRRVRVAGGTWVNGATTTQIATANGTYSFEVEDHAGNTSTVSANVTRIDKAAPNGTITGNPTAWQNTNATLTFNATDTGGSGVRRVRVAGGNWVNGSTTTQIATANGTYSFEVEDHAGNTRTVSANVTRIDKAAPSGTISGNPTSWQNTNATLTFNATDTGGSGVRRVRVAGGNWVNGTTTTQTATANGTYSFEVEDHAGNTSTVSANVTRIDKTLPNASSSQSPTGWTNGNVTITWTATAAGGSPLHQVRTHNGSSWSGWTTISGTSRTQTQVVSSNGTYQFQVQDAAGNVRQISHTVSNIDKADPSGAISQTPTGWTNGNVTLTFNATDTGGSGVRRVRIAGGTWVNGSTTTRTVSSNGTYSFEVEDHAGNTSTRTHTVTNIDKVLPNASSTQSPTAWTNGNVTITWNASATGSPLRRIRTHNGSTWGAWSSVSGTTAETTQTVTANGTYHFQVEDQAGNVREISRTVSNIDRTAPNASSSQSPTGWTNGNVTITWAANVSSQSPLQQVRTHNGSAWGSWTTISGTTRTQTQVVSSNGTYHFQVQDAAGNVRQISHTVSNIDKGVPDIRSSQSPTAWTNGNVTLTLGARDYGEGNGQDTHISGIASIQVKSPNGTTWSDTYGGASEKSTTYYNRTFTATENGTYVVTVTDRAGNTATHNHTVSNIDRALPTGSTNRQTGWTNGNVWIDVTGRDVDGGLASIKYVSGGTITGDTEFTFSGTTASQTVRFTATQNGTYTFDITDRAGNTRRVTQVVDNIDRTIPHGSTTQTPTAWTNQDIVIRLAGGDTNNQGSRISGVDRVRMRPVGASSWSETRTVSDSTEASPNFNPLNFTIKENGRYQFELRDRAGNTRMVEHTVTNIDRMPPTTSGSFTPDGWTNQTITITWLAERTGNPGAPLDAYRYDRGDGNWTSWQNATHADAFTVTQDVTENGVYRFDIRDEAGNVARSSVTVSQHDIVLPVGQITARYDRSERDDHIGYTSNDLVNMVDSRSVTVDVTNVEDLGISGVDFVTIEEQKRIGYGGEWMTVNETNYDWPDPYNTTSQTYTIDVAHAQDTRFILTVTDRAGNRSTRATSNVVRQSVLQVIDFRITDVVNPQLTSDEVAEIQTSDLSNGSIELTAGTNVTFDVTYQLRHLDTVDQLSGNIVIETVSDDKIHTHVIDVDEPLTGHNQHVTFTKTFTVPQGTPRGSEVNIVGNLVAEMANGTAHEISYPNTADMGVIDNHIEEFFRFRIVR